MSARQWVVLLAPIAVIASMFPVFRWLDPAAGDRVDGYLGWYLGLAAYWMVWGVGFSTWIVGPSQMRELLRPRTPTVNVVMLVAFPALAAGLVRWLIPEMGYPKPTVLVAVLLISTTFGNGIAEEMLWRGTFLHLFPDRWIIRVAYASVMFGLWHYVPVSLDATGPELWGMVLGPMVFGIILAAIARRTEGLFWPIVAHVLGGLVMIA